jgi:dihydroneopterin aldolase / 2-amino-4-hydroxy-6-hydroxymethyldihydropteridine diphosphokinase
MTSGFGPVLDADGNPLDQIRLLGLRARGHHGVFPQERREGQTFVADLVLHLDTRAAAARDDLTATVHYGELASAVAGAIRGAPVDLLETLVARIAAICLADEQVVAADVAVHKPEAPVGEQFGDVVVAVRRYAHPAPADQGILRDHAIPVHASASLDEIPDQPVDAVLALGANLGDRLATLRSALTALDGHGPDAVEGVGITAVSPVVETDPVGGPDQPDYLNAVALVRTSLSPRGLLAACQAVEAAHGRERAERWGPRTLDVDVITYSDLVASSDDLELPHPRAAVRGFVLRPWLLTDPGAMLPGAEGPRPVVDLLAVAADAGGVRLVEGAPLWSGEEPAP